MHIVLHTMHLAMSNTPPIQPTYTIVIFFTSLRCDMCEVICAI